MNISHWDTYSFHNLSLPYYIPHLTGAHLINKTDESHGPSEILQGWRDLLRDHETSGDGTKFEM